MAKPFRLTKDEVQGVLRDVLKEAQAGRPVIAYEGRAWVLCPVEDITRSFTPEELLEFKAAYTEAADPQNHLTDEQAKRLLADELANG